MSTKTESYAGSEIEVTEVDGTFVVAVDGIEIRKTFHSSALALDYARRRVTLKNRREARAEQPVGSTLDLTWSADDVIDYFDKKSRDRHARNRALLLERHGLDIGDFETWAAGDE